MRLVYMKKIIPVCVATIFFFNQVAFGAVSGYSALRPQKTAGKTADDLQKGLVSNDSNAGLKTSSAGLTQAQLEQFKAFYDPNLTADQMNARRLEVLIDKGLLKPSEFFWMEDELKNSDIPSTIQSLLNGELNIYIYSAGAASRMMNTLVRYGFVSQEDSKKEEVLRKYRRWNTDIWALVELIHSKQADLEIQLKQAQARLAKLSESDKRYKDTKTNISTLEILIDIAKEYPQVPSYAQHLTIGPRHIKALTDGIRIAARQHGFDAVKVISNLKLTLGVNAEILEDAQEDLKANNFFGLNPTNIVFVMNDFAPAYERKDGEFVLSNKSTNYSHGFNIINANILNSSYIYDTAQQRFVLQEAKAFSYLLSRGAKTTLIHRSNDLITIVPECALDLNMYALYRNLHQRHGANIMIEVLNNFSKQEGGLLFGRTDTEDPFGFLAEGLVTKTPKVQDALARLRQQYKEQTDVDDIPYNRLYQYFDIAQAQAGLEESHNLMPMSIKDVVKEGGKKIAGYYSPEIPTGGQTMLKGSKTVAAMRRNDFLIDNGILPEDIDYIVGKGALIHDFKELKNLPATIAVVNNQDKAPITGVIEKFSSAGISLTDRDIEHINLAAEIANLTDATGTIAYNDTALSSRQQQMMQSLIGTGTPRLAELEARLGCNVRLMSQGDIEDNANTIIISTEELKHFKNAKYFITEQQQIDTSYVAVAPLIAIAKGLLGLESRREQPKLYAALKNSIRSLSCGMLNERDIEAAITVYINGNPMFIKLPLPVSYDYDELEQLQRQAFMVLIAA
jgi:hypothetical protein